MLTLPEGMSRERSKLLRAYGAEVHETPSLGGMGEAIDLARRIMRERDGLHAAAVLQSREPGGSPADHGGGDLARHGRRDRRVRLRRRHRRHDHRRRPGAEGAAARGARDRGRADRLAGALRRRGGPAQDPGHRRRVRAGRARPLGDRRDPPGRRRGRAGVLAGGRSQGRPARRHLRRRRDLRVAAGCAAGPRWPASGWSRSRPTAASATCRCRSSRTERRDGRLPFR